MVQDNIRLIAAPSRITRGKAAIVHCSFLLDHLTELSQDQLNVLLGMQVSRGRTELAEYLVLGSLSPVVSNALTLMGEGGSRRSVDVERAGILSMLRRALLERSLLKQFEIIDALQVLGLVVTENSLLEQIRSAPRDECAISCCGIITSDRPASFSRALSAFAESITTYKPECRMVIVEDSKSPANREQAILHTLRVSRSRNVQMGLIGEEGRRKLTEDIARCTGLPTALLSFALVSRAGNISTAGSCRNVAHLLATKSVAIFSDDDTLPYYASLPGQNADTCFLSTSRPVYRTEFFPDRAGWLNNVRHEKSTDIFHLYESVVGQPLAAFRTSGRLSIKNCDQHLYSAMTRGECRVAVCTGGISGDNGMWSSAGFTLLAGDGTIANSSAIETFNRINNSRYVLHSPEGLQLTSAPQLQTMSYGVDLRHVVGPFFPFGRNEDGAFATLLHKTQPQLLTAHVPIAVQHEPCEDRHYLLNTIDALLTLRITDWVVLLLNSMAVPANILPEDAVMLAGRQLKSMLRVPSGSFMAHFCSLVLESRSANVLRARHLLEERDLPKPWRAELQNIAARLGIAKVSPLSVIPYELRSYVPGEAISFMIEAMTLYADLLCEWPLIVDTTHNLLKGEESKYFTTLLS